MKRKLTLIQIFWISLLLCSFTLAQQSDATLEHSDQKITLFEPFSIKLQRSRRLADPLSIGEPFTFPLRFSSENVTIPVGFSLQTSALWIRSSFYAERKGAPFHCSESKSCQGEESLEFAAERFYWKETATLVKEQVNFGGESTLPNFDVFIANPERLSDRAMLGLTFRRWANPKVPTIYEHLQDPILSISLKDSYEGELIFGGYPNNKTKADFKYLGLNTNDESGFSVPIKSMYQLPLADVSDRAFVGYGQGARLDFDSPVMRIPHDAYYRIRDFVWKHRLGILDYTGIGMHYANDLLAIKCSAKERMRNLFIQFEGLTLNIPPSAYIMSARDFNFENDFYVGQRVSLNEKCVVALMPSSDTVLGQPFFKSYDVVIDSKTNSVGFSPKFIPEPASFLANSRIRRSIFGLVGVIALALFGFFLHSMFNKYRKANGQKGKLDESAASVSFPSQGEVAEPVQSLPYPVDVGIPVQSLPYPYGYANLASDEKIEQN